MRATAGLIALALALFAAPARAAVFYQAELYQTSATCGGTPDVIATLPVNATACQFQTMPCMPDGPAGSNKTTCVESAALPPLVPTAITGTFAAGSIWMNTNCSGAPIAAVALHPGSCVSLSSAGLPAFVKASCEAGVGKGVAYTDANCTMPMGIDLTMGATCTAAGTLPFSVQGGCVTNGASVTTTAAPATTSAAPTSTSTSKPNSAGKVAGSFAAAAAAVAVAVAAF